MEDHVKILVVDDTPDLLQMLGTALPEKGLQVETSASAQEAAEFVKTSPFAALVTDALPGFEPLVRRFRQCNPHSPVIILTGGISPELEKKATAAGANLVLQKPLGINLLRRHVLELVTSAKRSVQHARTQSPRDTESVIELEKRLLKAWVAGDIGALDEILGEEYVFSANTPFAENKQQRLRALKEGRVRYADVILKDVSATSYGQLCVVNATIDIVGHREDGRDVSGRHLSVRVYSKKPSGWRAVAGQLVRTSALVA